MIKLKDCVIVEVIDDVEEFSEFAGTWSPDTIKTMHNLTLLTDTGQRVHLESFSDGDYGSINGFEDIGELYITILQEVYSGEMQERTLADFVQWIVEEYTNRAIIITYNNKKGYIYGGATHYDTQEYVVRMMLDWYIKAVQVELARKGLPKLNITERTKLYGEVKPLVDPQKVVFALAEDALYAPYSATIQEFLA